MKMFDFAKAKQIIEENKDSLEVASMGMQEDWFWTGETVWEEGKFTQELNEDTTIGGLQGSSWATPILLMQYKNGVEESLACYTGESSGVNQFGVALTSGPLSSKAQATMPPVREYKK